MHLHQKINANQLGNILSDPSPINKYNPVNFMNELAKYLTLVKPDKIDGKYSPGSIFDKLTEETYIRSDMGDIPTSWLKAAFKLLFATKRSAFIKNSSLNSSLSLYSPAVPYALYAFKSQYNVNYKEWNLEEPNYKGTDFNAGSILLGTGFKDYLKKRHLYSSYFKKPSPPKDWVPESWLEKYGSEVAFEGDMEHEWMPSWEKPRVDWDELRRGYLTHGQDPNHIIPEHLWAKGTFTSHELLIRMGSTGTIYHHMLTQTWVFSPKLRNKYMIMSFDDIDEMPDPIETPGIISTVQTGEKESPI